MSAENTVKKGQERICKGKKETEMTLKDLKPGDQALVCRITATGALKRRIMDMGITKGCEVLVRKLAPLGDPVEINLRGYELTLRKQECDAIEVEKLDQKGERV